jgi:predicted dehydrogenase
MFVQPSLTLLVAAGESDNAAPLLAYLNGLPHVHVTVLPQVPQAIENTDVVVTVGDVLPPDPPAGLKDFVAAGGGWLLVNPPDGKLCAELLGVKWGPSGPAAELRVLFTDPRHRLAARLPDAIYLKGVHRPVDGVAADTEVILYADWHYRHIPVLVRRRSGRGHVAATTLEDYGHPVLQQILYRLMRRLAGQAEPERPIGVGILGYAPSVGQFHGLGVRHTSGLALRAVCDLSPVRIEQAQQDFPGLKTGKSADELAADPDVDLVIVATAPNTHAVLSLQMLGAGKHVVCEKPLALSRSETQAMLRVAEDGGRHLSCHQNRRWDVDYRAIRQALVEGAIGDLFYLETFVGGFSHPCGYWHSHAPISGGTAYDWGAHYLDWVVGLIPDKVATVSAKSHKRVWHDVTNADQERIHILFASGKEADFMHSDIAAARKPKWYILGTEGAILGQWQDVAAYTVDPVHYFHRHEIPATEMTPELTLYRRHASGQIVPQQLAHPPREPYLFHKNLADHLLAGEPLATPLADSMRVVAILEAAKRSAAGGGRPEVVDE